MIYFLFQIAHVNIFHICVLCNIAMDVSYNEVEHFIAKMNFEGNVAVQSFDHVTIMITSER